MCPPKAGFAISIASHGFTAHGRLRQNLGSVEFTLKQDVLDAAPEAELVLKWERLENHECCVCCLHIIIADSFDISDSK